MTREQAAQVDEALDAYLDRREAPSPPDPWQVATLKVKIDALLAAQPACGCGRCGH